MVIRHVKIRNFRGIRELDWRVDGDLICLIGPGDATKTTILHAIEYTLSPRYTLPINDTDFYQCETTNSIQIDVTVAEFPKEFLTDNKFGLHMRGWRASVGLVDEPEDNCEHVLTIRFTATDSLEPAWEIYTERHDHLPTISWRDREKLGAALLGTDVDRNLSWARGSALTKLTQKEEDATYSILANAHRTTKNAVNAKPPESLIAAAKEAQVAGQHLGVDPKAPLKPALDSKSLAISGGAISLHEGNIPTSARGLGAKRLLSLGIQRAAIADGAILLIDEIEAGLEPHRLRRLVRVLSDPSFSNSPERDVATPRHGQAITTTHSPIAIVELKAEQLNIVRSHDGRTVVKSVSAKLQDLVRKSPEAFLAKRIVVCEGKTEVGLWRGLRDHWQSGHVDKLPVEYFGTIAAYGGGRNEGPNIAISLHSLGFPVLYFGDSDEPMQPTADELSKQGATVVLWADNSSTEDRIARDLPPEQLQELIDVAIEEWGEQCVREGICSHLDPKPQSKLCIIKHWFDEGIREKSIRDAFATAAKSKSGKKGSGWFKRIDLGERIAKIVAKVLPGISNTDLATKLTQVEKWSYEN